MGQHNGIFQSEQCISHRLHVHRMLPEDRQKRGCYKEGQKQTPTSSYMYDNVPVEAWFWPLIICHSYITMRMAVERTGNAERTIAPRTSKE